MNMDAMMKSKMQTMVKGEQPDIDRKETLEEFKKMEEQCKVIEDSIKEKNDEIQKLKQNLLLSMGAKMALGKVLGINT